MPSHRSRLSSLPITGRKQLFVLEFGKFGAWRVRYCNLYVLSLWSTRGFFVFYYGCKWKTFCWFSYFTGRRWELRVWQGSQNWTWVVWCHLYTLVADRDEGRNHFLSLFFLLAIHGHFLLLILSFFIHLDELKHKLFLLAMASASTIITTSLCFFHTTQKFQTTL